MKTRDSSRDRSIQMSMLEALEERLFLSADNRLGEHPSSFFAHNSSVLLGASPRTGTTATSTDDYGNTLATASGIVLDSTGTASVSGQVNSAGDVDVFFLTPSKDGRLTINLTAIVSRRISISGDLSACTDTVEIARDANAADTGASVSFDVKAGTKYYGRVATLNGQSGKYTLGFSEVWVTPPPAPTPPPPAPTPPPPAPTSLPPSAPFFIASSYHSSICGLLIPLERLRLCSQCSCMMTPKSDVRPFSSAVLLRCPSSLT